MLHLTYGRSSILRTGDIEHETDPDLLRWGKRLEADVLKAAHHGSRTSSTKRFLEGVGSKLVLVSCGVKNKYKHSAPEVIERYVDLGMEVLRTDQSGALALQLTKESVTASKWPNQGTIHVATKIETNLYWIYSASGNRVNPKGRVMKQVLVVDDVAEVRILLRTVIEEPGVEVIEAVDGKEALHVLKLQDVNLVITACKMPNMSGLELMEAAREDDPELKFIVVSPTATEEDFKHLRPEAIMAKPFRLTELKDAVSDALN